MCRLSALKDCKFMNGTTSILFVASNQYCQCLFMHITWFRLSRACYVKAKTLCRSVKNDQILYRVARACLRLSGVQSDCNYQIFCADRTLHILRVRYLCWNYVWNVDSLTCCLRWIKIFLKRFNKFLVFFESRVKDLPLVYQNKLFFKYDPWQVSLLSVLIRK